MLPSSDVGVGRKGPHTELCDTCEERADGQQRVHARCASPCMAARPERAVCDVYSKRRCVDETLYNIWQRVTATRVLLPGKASVRDDGSDGRTLMRRAVRGTPEATETTEATVTTEALLMRRAVRGTLKRRKRCAGDVDATQAMLRRCDVQPTEAMRVYRLCAMRAERQKTSNDD